MEQSSGNAEQAHEAQKHITRAGVFVAVILIGGVALGYVGMVASGMAASPRFFSHQNLQSELGPDPERVDLPDPDHVTNDKLHQEEQPPG